MIWSYGFTDAAGPSWSAGDGITLGGSKRHLQRIFLLFRQRIPAAPNNPTPEQKAFRSL